MTSATLRIASAATFIAALLVAPSVLAHAHLLQETPAADSVADSSPAQLTLNFSEGVNLPLTGITLTSADQKVIQTDAATLAPQNDKQLIVPLKNPLPSGQYQVDWKAVAVDGHKTHGTYHFSVK